MANIEKIIQEVLDQLNSQLTNDITEVQRDRLISEAFAAAFNQVANQDNKLLYRKLSLLFHPDKLPQSSEPYAEHLKKNGCDQNAQKILETFKKNSWLQSKVLLPKEFTEFADGLFKELHEFGQSMDNIKKKYKSFSCNLLFMIMLFIVLFSFSCNPFFLWGILIVAYIEHFSHCVAHIIK